MHFGPTNATQAIVFVAVWCFLAFIGYRMGQSKGRPTLGALLGFMLGLIGLLIMLVIPATKEAKAAKAERMTGQPTLHADGTECQVTGLRPPDSPPTWEPQDTKTEA